MKIWIDADACPRVVKDLCFRASQRLKLPVVMVADRWLPLPGGRLVTMQVVPKDMDSADRHIAENLEPGDLVITADIPLAAETVRKGGTAINPRGETYTGENIGERLATRDLLMGLRETGMELSGPQPYTKKDRARFNAAFDRFLTRHSR